MAHCVNVRSREYLNLLRDLKSKGSKMGQREIKARILLWQEKIGGLDKFPTAEQVVNLTNITIPRIERNIINNPKEIISEVVSLESTQDSLANLVNSSQNRIELKEKSNVIKNLEINYSETDEGNGKNIDNALKNLLGSDYQKVRDLYKGYTEKYYLEALATNYIKADLGILPSKLDPVGKYLWELKRARTALKKELIFDTVQRAGSHLSNQGRLDFSKGANEGYISELLSKEPGNKITMSSKEILRRIINMQGKIGNNRVLAKKFMDIVSKNNVKITFHLDIDSKGNAVGEYNTGTNKIDIYRDGVNPTTILHEIAHSFTSNYLIKNPNSLEAQELRRAIKVVESYLRENNLMEEYGYSVSNEREFMASVYSNYGFTNEILKISKENTPGFNNFMDWLKHIFMEIFNHFDSSKSFQRHLGQIYDDVLNKAIQSEDFTWDGGVSVIDQSVSPATEANRRLNQTYTPREIDELGTTFRDLFMRVVDRHTQEEKFAGKSRPYVIRNVKYGELTGPRALWEEVRQNLKNSLSSGKLAVHHATAINKAINNFEDIVRRSSGKVNATEGLKFEFDTLTPLDYNPEQETYADGTSQEADINENDDSGEEKAKERWGDTVKFTSVMSSLTPMIKRAIAGISMTNEKGNPVPNMLGFPKRMNEGVVINHLLRGTQNVITSKDFLPALMKLAKTEPWVNEVIKKIVGNPEKGVPGNNQLFSQLYVALRKDHTRFDIVRTIRNNDGTYSYQSYPINLSDSITGYIDDWRNIIEGGMGVNPRLSVYNSDGTFNIKNAQKILGTNDNPSKSSILELIKRWNEVKLQGVEARANFIKSSYTAIQEHLASIGVSVNPEELNKSFNDALEADNKKTDFNIDTILEVLKQQVNWVTKQDAAKPGAAFKMLGDNTGNYRTIAGIIASTAEELIEGSVSESGKTYYTYIQPSFISKFTKQIRNATGNIDDFNQFIDSEFKQYEGTIYNADGTYNIAWLNKIVQDPSKRKLFQHKAVVNFDRVEYSKLTSHQYARMLLSNYFVEGQGLSKGSAWYHIPVLSDSPSAEFIRFDKYETNFRKNVASDLLNLFTYEYNRIKTVRARAKTEGVQKIKSFDDRGDRFVFLDYLNDHIAEIDKIMSSTNEAEKSAGLDKVKGWIQAALEEKANDFIKDATKMGLLERTNKSNSHSSFVYLDGMGITDANYEEKLKEYFYNSYNATANIIQLTSTDLAYFKDLTDFQKRNKQLHAPGLQPNTLAKDSKDNYVFVDKYGNYKNTESYIVLKDVNEDSASELISEIKAALDNNKNLTEANKMSILAKFGYTNATVDELDKNGKPTGKKIKVAKDFSTGIYFETASNNITDAQAYRSLRSYRKILGGYGKLTAEAEASLDRLSNGTWTWDDYESIFNAIKPYVYTQTAVDSKVDSNGKRVKIKVPTQHKNSEALLLPSMGINSGGFGSHRLEAIMDIMDKEDIDVVQFESAVKVGLQGAIDISQFTTKKQIVDHISSQLSDNQILHEIPYEDYKIQQENPESLIDHNTLIGSQIRKLSLSDISPTAIFRVGNKDYKGNELIKRANELIIEKTLRNYKSLQKIFENDETLQEKIASEINSKERYSQDLLNAIELEDVKKPDGSTYKRFKLPLYDPIQSTRIQQLLNSIWKKAINKQESSGGKAIQMSSFGYSDKLKLVMENGAIKEAQVLIPFWENAPKEIYDKYDPNGTGTLDMQEMLKDGVLDPKMLQIIGYRIPTEDKYSMIPIKVVGFLPRSAGSMIVMPREMTTLNGSDFDVDKMYLMFQTSKFNNGRYEAVKYFTETTEKGRDKQGNLYEKKIPHDVGDYKSMDEIDNAYHDLLWGILTNADTAPKMLNPGGFDDLKDSAKRVELLASNPDYTWERIQKMTTKEVDEATSGGNLDMMNPMTQLKFHRQNMVAAQLIGMIANHNTNHAIRQYIKVGPNNEGLYVRDIQVKRGEEVISYDRYRLAGDFKSRLDKSTNDHGLISKELASYLAASVDAVKDPVLTFMNLSPLTTDSAMLLASVGYNSTDIGLLLRQPAIEDFINRAELGVSTGVQKNVSLKETIDQWFNNASSYKSSTTGDAKNDLKLRYSTFDSYIANVATSDENFTREKMAKMLDIGKRIKLGEKFKDDVLADYYKFQFQALLNYSQIMEAGQSLGDFITATRADTQNGGPGPFIADTIQKAMKILDVSEKPGIIANTNIIKPGNLSFDVNELRKQFRESQLGFVQGFITLGIYHNLAYMSRLFPQTQEPVQYVLRAVQALTNTGRMTTSQINNVINEFMTYYMSQVPGFTHAETRKLITEFPAKLLDLKNRGDIGATTLLKSLSFVRPNKEFPLGAIKFRPGGKTNNNQREEIILDWESLLLQKDEKLKDLAQELLTYFYRVNGFNFGNQTPTHMTPTLVKTSNEGYIEALHRLMDYKLFTKDDAGNIWDGDKLMNDYTGHYFTKDNLDIFVGQYMRNHLRDTRFVTEAGSVPVDMFIDTQGSPLNTFKMTINPNQNIELYLDGKSPAYISKIIKDKTYYYRLSVNELEAVDGRGKRLEGTFTRVEPLGIKNNLVEYAFNEPLITSVVTQADWDKMVEDNMKSWAPGPTYDDMPPEYGSSNVTIPPGEQEHYDNPIFPDASEIPSFDQMAAAGIPSFMDLVRANQVRQKQARLTPESEMPQQRATRQQTISIPMQPDNIQKILNGTKTTTTRTDDFGMKDGETVITNIGGRDFYLTKRGNLTIEEAGGRAAMEKSENFENNTPKYQHTVDWLNGKGRLNVFDIKPIQSQAASIEDGGYYDPGVFNLTPEEAAKAEEYKTYCNL